MLKFTSKGLLVPNRNIISSLAELKEEFLDNIFTQNRKSLFENYIKYSDDLSKTCKGSKIRQWIDGSFVTKNSKPKDIDIVSFIEYQIIDSNEPIFTNFKFPNSINKYGVDAYIVKVYPDDHKKYPLYIGDRMYWMDRFDKTRRNRAGNKVPKGFLEILY